MYERILWTEDGRVRRTTALLVVFFCFLLADFSSTTAFVPSSLSQPRPALRKSRPSVLLSDGEGVNGGHGGAGQQELHRTTTTTNGGTATKEEEEEEEASPSASSASSSVGYNPSRWDTFDYLQHWYPMCWAVDMPKNGQPVKLTLFDVDYAVAYNQTSSGHRVMAFVDACPHRASALSEGRTSNNGKYLQCAYHGWSFDRTGACVDIPQQQQSKIGGPSTAARRPPPPASCAADAVPACLHQDMIWLWPGPHLGADPRLLPPPPSVPEMELPGYAHCPTVRDFPMIDWSLLLSNIMDPDHGLFAHQNTGFDWYSASREHVLKVDESFEGAGWTMSSRVDAVEKLLDRSAAPKKPLKNNNKNKQQEKKEKEVGVNDALMATTTFYAPTVVTICRRDGHNRTKFSTCFWVCPTGTGRSRFMAASVGKASFTIPRWIQHVMLNGFLDQDSVLVASQQPSTLTAEANDAIRKQQQQQEEEAQSQAHKNGGFGARQPETKKNKGSRQSLYKYQSPTDRTVRLIDSFWDATLSRAPNRVESLLELHGRGELRRLVPDRTEILDRASQHLAICPDSQDFVRNCKYITTGSLAFSATWLALRLLSSLPASSSFSSSLLLRIARPMRSVVWPVLASFVAWAAHSLRRSFFYSYTEDKLHRDLQRIPTRIWADPE